MRPDQCRFMHCCSLYSPHETPGKELVIGGVCAFVASIVATSPQLTSGMSRRGTRSTTAIRAKVSISHRPSYAITCFRSARACLLLAPLYLLMIRCLAGEPSASPRSKLRLDIDHAYRVLSRRFLGRLHRDRLGSRQSIELFSQFLMVPFAGAVTSLLATVGDGHRHASPSF